jgi:hypothetical protein
MIQPDGSGFVPQCDGARQERGQANQLFRMTFELRNPAVALPKFNIVTVDHFAGAFACGGVVLADEIDGLHEVAVSANKVSSIV